MNKNSLDNDGFIAYLFNADHPVLTQKPNYATPCQEELLKAIASVDHRQSLKAGVRHGDVLIHNVASKPSVIEFYPPPSNTTSWTAGRYQGKTDKRVLYTAINELKDDFLSFETSINIELITHHLLKHNIYCLSLFPIDLIFANLIDEKITKFAPYIGMAVLNKKSELHVQLFAELPECGFFDNGTMFRSLTIFNEKLNNFGDEERSLIPIIDIPYAEYKSLAPQFPSKKDLPKHSEDELNKLQTVMLNTHSEQLAQELISTFGSGMHASHAISFTSLTSDEEHLKIPIEKLLNYVLDVEHEKGKDKAYLFKSLLGIDSNQWRYLAYQLINESNRAKIRELTQTEYGLKYVTIVEVIGLNGDRASVKAAWKVNNNISQLITAYPVKKPKEAPKDNTNPPNIILKKWGSERYWKDIFEAASQAGKKSAEECIPEPLIWQSYFSQGLKIDSEGKCGQAYIILNGGSEFAHWLIRNKYGVKSRHSNDIEIQAKSGKQSIDRNKSYANSFSKILWLNGIDIKDIICILS
ncbi:DUF6883 domain-containing protein [Siccibacter turicensis]|uniref:DUF6883 domain-containing protein n=1 Tax=Siccibacter turicensis TaxID=357233 RepID=UPI002A6A5FCC|nr:DUF6883 domain-containing protein [Siccibacter turicensis]MDY0971215.1 hypothetical protein [Siccibacter turicensis]